MYLIVGLGNPEVQYRYTRHNIGFETINKIAYDHNIEVTKKKHKALIGKGKINGVDVILAKPQTFMNLSGESVQEILKFYNIPVSNMIVLYDDISLDVGSIRIRKKGSAGGHNGVKNIILHTKTDVFLRVKIGVGEKPSFMDLKNYVLSRFLPEENEMMIEGVTKAGDATVALLSEEPDKVMNIYNVRKKTGE